MARFDLYAPTLKKWEGGFVNHPKDPGGATNMGVTLKTFQQWFGADKTVDDLKNISDYQWTLIMKRGYWDKMGADKLQNQSVAELCVDWVVNAGPSIIKKIQSIVGVNADGIVGDKTIAAINRYPQECLHCKVKKARLEFYEKKAEDPSKKIFLAGWKNRTNSFIYNAR